MRWKTGKPRTSWEKATALNKHLDTRELVEKFENGGHKTDPSVNTSSIVIESGSESSGVVSIQAKESSRRH